MKNFVFLCLLFFSHFSNSFAQNSLTEGDKKFEKLDFDGAIDEYTKTIDKDSKNTTAYLKRGTSYYMITSFNKSIIDFTKVIIYKTDKINKEKAYLFRGLARLATKQYQSALADFDEAVELDSTYYDALRYRGIARLHLNKTGAIQDLKSAVDHSSKSGQFYLDLVQDIKKTKTKNQEVLTKSKEWFEISKKLTNKDTLIVSNNSKLILDPSKDKSLSQETGEKGITIKDQKPKPNSTTGNNSLIEKNNPINNQKQDHLKSETEDIDFVMKVKRPQIWAVVIGVSAYKNNKISLKYAAKDAKDFYNFLKTKEGGNVDEGHISLLIDQSATRKNILSALGEKFNQANEDDVVIFYMASHGQPDPVGDQVYFLNYDADLKEPAGTAIAHAEIERLFRKTKASKKLWIADACHSGAVGGLEANFSKVSDGEKGVSINPINKDKKSSKELSENSLTSQLLDEMSQANPSTALLTASSNSEFSYESIKWGGGHGVFTFHLLEGLNGKADLNKDKIVTIRELYNYVYKFVSSDTEERQHPELKGNFDNRLPISIVSK